MPKHPRGRPLYFKQVPFNFSGMVKISDHDKCAAYVRFLGEYTCNGCGAKGGQVLTLRKAMWKKGFTQQDVEVGMQDHIRLNHVCKIPVYAEGTA